MAVSAFTTRRAYAAAFIIAAWLILNAAADSLTSITENDCLSSFNSETPVECEYSIGAIAPYVGLLSVSGLTDNINNMVFGVEVTPGQASPSSIAVSRLHDAYPIAAYLAANALAALLLWNRYRRIRL